MNESSCEFQGINADHCRRLQFIALINGERHYRKSSTSPLMKTYCFPIFTWRSTFPPLVHESHIYVYIFGLLATLRLQRCTLANRTCSRKERGPTNLSPYLAGCIILRLHPEDHLNYSFSNSIACTYPCFTLLPLLLHTDSAAAFNFSRCFRMGYARAILCWACWYFQTSRVVF